MSTAHLPLFERLSRLLNPLDPAEVHGFLCGLLCADSTLARDHWLALARGELTDGVELTEPVRGLLSKLFEFGVAQLNAADGSVTPLLPDDDAPLRQRTDALGAWCHGLLYGLGLGQVERRGLLSEESQEFLRDATQIAQVGFETDTASEADEIAYAEVVEYLRVGLLMILEDLRRFAPSSRLH
ncbi:MAG: UPF0149 family protein [Candidatus Contendobacter sp.]|nr:UPF0149 family protein [Candidatus Contendobacter sp.]MDG4556531.1 UPF0149 family protein [Candidatus Contendobacter sp.]